MLLLASCQVDRATEVVVYVDFGIERAQLPPYRYGPNDCVSRYCDGHSVFLRLDYLTTFSFCPSCKISAPLGVKNSGFTVSVICRRCHHAPVTR